MMGSGSSRPTLRRLSTARSLWIGRHVHPANWGATQDQSRRAVQPQCRRDAGTAQERGRAVWLVPKISSRERLPLAVRIALIVLPACAAVAAIGAVRAAGVRADAAHPVGRVALARAARGVSTATTAGPDAFARSRISLPLLGALAIIGAALPVFAAPLSRKAAPGRRGIGSGQSRQREAGASQLLEGRAPDPKCPEPPGPVVEPTIVHAIPPLVTPTVCGTISRTGNHCLTHRLSARAITHRVVTPFRSRPNTGTASSPVRDASSTPVGIEPSFQGYWYQWLS
jgi:hypothetical protein